MKKIILILLISFVMKGQTSWDRVVIKLMENDDWIHMTGSMVTMVASSEIAYSFTKNPNGMLFKNSSKSILIGVTATTIIWQGKEFIYDKMLGKGVFNWIDVINNIWGMVVGTIIEICWLDYKDSKQNKYQYKLQVYE